MNTVNMMKDRQTNSNISLIFRTLGSASFPSCQPLQRGVCWWQKDYITSGWNPGQCHNLWLGVQCDAPSPPSDLTSSQLCDYFKRGIPVWRRARQLVLPVNLRTFSLSTTKVCKFKIVMSHLNLIQFYTEQESALYIKQLQKKKKCTYGHLGFVFKLLFWTYPFKI